jgi:hypothetical protein
VEVVSAAVSDRSGTISLYLPDDPMFSDTSTNAQHRPNRREVKVKAIALDDFVHERQLESVDLLKIDTETTEPDVLAGFKETLSRCRPVFICEILPAADLAALESFSKEYNYAYGSIGKTGLKPEQKIMPDPAGDSINYLFFPRAGNGPMHAEIQRRISKAS